MLRSGECAAEFSEFLGRKRILRHGRIVQCMLSTAAARNRDDIRLMQHEGQQHLHRRESMRMRNFAHDLAADQTASQTPA